ncbi:MAG: cupin domain-containing protein [Patescibacteria group bacterium]|jgi:mannose-6-phosphate isomerase-like protein (cupin superfamily)
MTTPLHHLEQATKDNDLFRKVLSTSPHLQLVLMTLQPDEEIGEEVHVDNDQFLRFEMGTGKVTLNGEEYPVTDGDAIIIPAGAKHNVINLSHNEPLKLYTLYGPPHHAEGTIHATKKEADAAEEQEHHG